ncbi:hypothetical protein FVER14953_20670 [Fusarium verticillioides]|nr:hypothetical protein FVER14953_20670 [Fusarium verticillioides]
MRLNILPKNLVYLTSIDPANTQTNLDSKEQSNNYLQLPSLIKLLIYKEVHHIISQALYVLMTTLLS